MSVLRAALPAMSPRGSRGYRRRLELIVYALVALAALAAVRLGGSHAPLEVLAIVAFAAIGVWMFFSTRYELTLAVLLLYLGLLDGYIKLKTNASYATLGRDVLLYAICLGVLARGVVQRRPLPRLAPLATWIVALVAVALAELFNPGAESLVHSFAGLRPQLEFVPLFFLGYTVLRSARRLRGLLVLLVIVGAANGLVSTYQFGLTPAQLAAWGPGYASDINGTGFLSGRTFVNAATGVSEVRPFGLGSDEGDGGDWGLVALPAALAFLSLGARRRSLLALGIVGVAGSVAGIVTSEGRGVLIGGLVTVLAFIVLTVSARRLVPALASFAAAVVIGAIVVTAVADANASRGSPLTRYGSVTPAALLSTTSRDRGASIATGLRYLYTLPFGAGLGHVGPAEVSTGASGVSRYNGEDEFNFLIVELGDAGLVIMLALTLRVLWAARTIRRVGDEQLRFLLAAVAAPLFGITIQYVNGPATSASPYSPFFWLAGGVMSYWLLRPDRPAFERAREPDLAA